MTKRYRKSEQLLQKALNIIPMGTQTYSKSTRWYPYGISPYFVSESKGAYVWDIDGNKYIDFVNALLAIILGYQDKDVDNAVKSQIKKGTLFSLSSTLETLLAQRIIKMVPCAEMVKFGKNGADVTTAAIRLARAYTKKEHVAMCGYHGSNDWSNCTNPDAKGIPECTKLLTHTFKYNNISSLEEIFYKHKNQVAAVIMEPMRHEFPFNNFLQKVKSLTHKNKALLIFDEIVTGFRVSDGGAQKLFNVTPDLACFGKAMANGYPLSALVGKRNIMTLIEKTFYTLTYGGETLSLAASLATLKKIEKNKVIDKINKKGHYLVEKIKLLIIKHELTEILSIVGHNTFSRLIFNNINIFTNVDLYAFFIQETLKNGILSLGIHAINYCHKKQDIDYLLKVYDEIFRQIKNHLETGIDLKLNIKEEPKI